MKRTWVYIDGEAYEKGEAPRAEGPMVMGDIAPYRSMIDGRMITSRSAHRDHLRANGCVELGNEVAHATPPAGLPDANPEGRKELIRAQVDSMSHADFKRALRSDVERVKWNSRER